MTDRELFIETLRRADRSGIENLIAWLDTTDFFDAPASIRMCKPYRGGLCKKALIRYDQLSSMVKSNALPINDTSIILTALLPNLDKINFFELTSINKKEYTPSGSKRDELGTFEWKSEVGYKIKDAEERFIFGTSGQNAERIITGFIPLTDEESVAIINMGVTYENPTFYFADIYKKYPLACLLNAADSLATYVIEEVLPF